MPARATPSAAGQAPATAKSAKNAKEILLGFPKITFPFALFAPACRRAGPLRLNPALETAMNGLAANRPLG
jgi:hypothetical protein